MFRKVIFVAISDKSFSDRVRKLLPADTECICIDGEDAPELMREALGGRDNLLFVDFERLHWLTGAKRQSKAIVVSGLYDFRIEYLSARLGANGFITRDIPAGALRKAMSAVALGQSWITRSVGGMVIGTFRDMVRT